MKKKIILLVILFAICLSHLFAQKADSLQKLNPKLLTGYFILLRDSIKEVSKDVSIPTLDFNVFFLEKIESINIENLRLINRPTYDSITIVSGGTSYAIASSQDHKDYINWLIKNKYFEKADKGENIYDLKKIPTCLVKSKKRFASIFKGSITVLGSFYPYNKLNLQSQKLFMYIPIESNKTEYIYSIVF